MDVGGGYSAVPEEQGQQPASTRLQHEGVRGRYGNAWFSRCTAVCVVVASMGYLPLVAVLRYHPSLHDQARRVTRGTVRLGCVQTCLRLSEA